jgi:hypothetical protein
MSWRQDVASIRREAGSSKMVDAFILGHRVVSDWKLLQDNNMWKRHSPFLVFATLMTPIQIARAEPEVLAAPLAPVSSNGLIGIPSYGTFVSLNVATNPFRPWATISLSKSYFRSSVALIGDGSSGYRWRASDNKLFLESEPRPKIGLRYSYGLAGADRDTKAFALQTACDSGSRQELQGECASDPAGASIPGLNFSVGFYRETEPVGFAGHLVADAILDYTFSPRLMIFGSGALRRVSAPPDDDNPDERFNEWSGVVGVLTRAWGSDDFGSTNLTAGALLRTIIVSRTDVSASTEALASFSLRTGSLAISIGFGYVHVPRNVIATRRSPMMFTVAYSL